MSDNTNNRPAKVVYTVTEGKDKSFWTKIGVGFVNKDDSLNVVLDALPVNGKLHIRDWTDKEATKA